MELFLCKRVEGEGWLKIRGSTSDIDYRMPSTHRIDNRPSRFLQKSMIFSGNFAGKDKTDMPSYVCILVEGH